MSARGSVAWLSALLLPLATVALPAEGEVLYHWTQAAQGGEQSFRAIVDDDACPTVTIDGEAVAMTPRGAKSEAFPVLACEALAGRDVGAAALGERSFPLLPKNPRRILLIGDTGCRILERRDGLYMQACEDPKAWPFAELARSAAAKQAQLAIHLGDYHYREAPCPDPAVCGSVWGYNWASWEADFFKPGSPLLEARPFVFVRGNHEDCRRAWRGFRRFLSPDPLPDPNWCDNYNRPLVVPFEDLTLGALDSSTRSRRFYTWDRFRAMRRQFVELLPHLSGESWVLTHAPLWGYGESFGERNHFTFRETIQREAYGAMLPRSVTAVMSGDLHFAQIVSVAGRPPQVIVGNSGVALYNTNEGRAKDVPVGEGVVGDVFSLHGFGFAVVDRDHASYLTFYGESGKPLARCDLSIGADSCRRYN